MLSHSYDRHVDRVPAEARHASLGKVLPFDVPGSIEIGVDLIATGKAPEDRLCRPVPLVNKPALGAPLRRVTGIDSFNAGASLFGLVGREGAKLGIAPAMMPSPLLAATLLGSTADICEVFNNDNASRLHVLNDALAQNVVAIFPKPCLPTSDHLQMTLGRLAAFGLKFATKTEVPFLNLLPTPFPQELPVGQNGRSVDAKVNANGLTGGCDLWRIYGNDDIEPPAGRSAHKVGAVEADRPVKPVLGMIVKVKRELDAAFHSGQADKSLFNLHAIGSCVVPNGTPFSMRSAHLSALLQQRAGGFNSLRRLHPGRYHQLAWKGRVLGPKIVVRRLVQRHSVPDPVFPSVFRDRVEAVPASRQRLRQDGILFERGFDADGKSALHSSYMERNLSMFKPCSTCVPHFLCPLKSAVSMRGN